MRERSMRERSTAKNGRQGGDPGARSTDRRGGEPQARSTNQPGRLPGVRPTIDAVQAYVPGKTVEEVRRELGLDHVVKLGSNENPYAPFPTALKAMQESLHSIHAYPEASFVELRKLIGEKLGLAAGNVAIAHGAGGMLETLARTFILPGDEVILPRQTYGLYREISLFMGATLRTVELDEHYRLRLEAVRAQVSENTKLVWICNPNNPTGTVMPDTDLRPLLEELPDQAWLVLDEAYMEFAEPSDLPRALQAIRENQRIIVVRTFSKAYGLAGARLGYALSREDAIRAIDTVAEPFNANRVGLAGATAVLTHDLDAVQDARSRIIASRESLERWLSSLGARVTPTATNFLFFELPGGAPEADRVARSLLERGVIVRSCSGWGFDRHLRVTVGREEENRTFMEMLQEVLADG